MRWKNRIIGEGMESPEQLLAHPNNWRAHSKAQQDALQGILHEVGFVQRVIVNRRTGFVVDGHCRVALAMRENQPEIPVLYVDLSEREEALVLAVLDPIGAMANTDADQLRALLEDVDTGEHALMMLLDQLATDADIVPGREPEKAPPEPPGPSVTTCPHCGHEF